MQALSQRLSHFDAILVTHAHYDHVAGLDDLRPITERRGHMPIYGIASTLEGIRERFSYAFVPIPDASTRPGMELIEITNHQPFSINGTEIMPLEIMHGTWRISAFRVGKLGYVTDASEIPPATMEQLRDLDVLVLNALRFKYHPTHFTLDQALEIVKQLRPRRTFFVHLTHAFDHTTVNAELPPGVALAYDGQEIEIEEFH
jgi:phosphoribosyl 1,2-cyclic phosphate phosphodiesterase